MNDIQLTTNFWMREFLRSQQAARIGREIIPTVEVIKNITRLCRDALQPARDQLNRVFTIDSGYRPDWLNVMTPGASLTSYHMLGLAADVLVAGIKPALFSKWLARKMIELPDVFIVDKVIDEYEQWTHVQVAKPGVPPRRLFLLARHVKGEIVYTPGEL
jgi:hypothetical protein